MTDDRPTPNVAPGTVERRIDSAMPKSWLTLWKRIFSAARPPVPRTASASASM